MVYSVRNKKINWLRVNVLYSYQFWFISLGLFLSSNSRLLSEISHSDDSVLFDVNRFLYVNTISALLVMALYLPRFYLDRAWSLLDCCLFDAENQTIEFQYYFLGIKKTLSVSMTSVQYLEICRKRPLSDKIMKEQKVYINNKLLFVVFCDGSSANKNNYDVLRHLLQKFCTKKEYAY